MGHTYNSNRSQLRTDRVHIKDDGSRVRGFSHTSCFGLHSKMSRPVLLLVFVLACTIICAVQGGSSSQLPESPTVVDITNEAKRIEKRHIGVGGIGIGVIGVGGVGGFGDYYGGGGYPGYYNAYPGYYYPQYPSYYQPYYPASPYYGGGGGGGYEYSEHHYHGHHGGIY